MFPCPHCGKKVDVGPPANVAWWQYDSGRAPVSLGCGTLILIAVIVGIFSKGGDDTHAIRALQKDIQKLEQKIDNVAVKLATAPKALPAEDN